MTAAFHQDDSSMIPGDGAGLLRCAIGTTLPGTWLLVDLRAGSTGELAWDINQSID